MANEDEVISQASDQLSSKPVTVEKNVPLEIDLSYLLCSDYNPISGEDLAAHKDAYLKSLARDGVQALLSLLLARPIKQSVDGPSASLPTEGASGSLFLLPRSKSLPKPKAETKWEKFARHKGIQHSKKDRKVFDEDRQEWVNRWGKDGKNQQFEKQWITEIPTGKTADHDPTTIAKAERKARKAQNEKQRLRNESDSAKAKELRSKKTERGDEVKKTLLQSKGSTASMGKFDRQLKGDPKARGLKRSFQPTERSVADETSEAMSILGNLNSAQNPNKRAKKELNERKAVNFVRRESENASRGEGTSRGRGGGRGGRGGRGRK